MLAIYVIMRIYFEISLSMLWEVSSTTNLSIFCLLTALAWGAIRLITIRSKADLSDQSAWGFGQVLSVLVLVLPFLSLAEQLFTKEATNGGNRDTSNTVSYRESTEFAEFLTTSKLRTRKSIRNAFRYIVVISSNLESVVSKSSSISGVESR